MGKDFFRFENEVVISMRNVNVAYKSSSRDVSDKSVIENLDLDIHHGEFLVILGPSGAGKTTILSTIAGIIKPDSGDILMKNEPINGMDWHREIVFQSPTLYPWYDVYDNVAYGLKVRKTPRDKIDSKVKEYLSLVGLEDSVHSKVYELSGGMKQRVALARVLINEPDIILMDEPFGALDAFTRSNMQTLIRDIWRKKENTIVLITHDVDEALELASRIIVLSDEGCKIRGMYNAMFSTPLSGTNEDDKIKSSDEYINLKHEILNLLRS